MYDWIRELNDQNTAYWATYRKEFRYGGEVDEKAHMATESQVSGMRQTSTSNSIQGFLFPQKTPVLTEKERLLDYLKYNRQTHTATSFPSLLYDKIE